MWGERRREFNGIDLGKVIVAKAPEMETIIYSIPESQNWPWHLVSEGHEFT
jgi:hypothetical protein